MIDFSGNVVLVTGGSRGIGRATCELFGKLGATVVVNYIQQEQAAKNILTIIEHTGGRGMIYGCDVADGAAVDMMMKKIVSHFGSIDILVNNAGVWLPASIRDFPQDIYKKTIAINLDGVVHCCRAVVPYMSQQGGGRIINVSSTAGQRGEAGYSPYAATKGAVISLTKSLAAELAQDNILVNCVAPGWVRTDMSADTLENEKDAILRVIPLKRTAEPEEIAWPIVFLASEGASYITGEIFNVNGGSVLCG